MKPTAPEFFDAIEATWPAAQYVQQGPWLLRSGQGGGKRVSATTLNGAFDPRGIENAENAMSALGQQNLFMIREDEEDLDASLADRGYQVVDPVVVLTQPVEALTTTPVPKLVTFRIWEPLAIMAEIWAQGGIGPARLNVMHRATTKTGIFGRWNARPAATAFVAVDGGIAMVHAVEVLSEHRRQGVAQWVMRDAAFWARDQGAQTIAVLCTTENTAALALYSSLGFEPVAQYHYRHLPASGDPRDS